MKHMKTLPMISALVAALLAQAALGSDLSDAGAGAELLISGPLEKVDAALDSVTVFGHDIHTDSASVLSAGQVVNVYGKLSSDGSIKDAEIQATGEYGSGSDQVFVKGIVTDVNPALGQVQFGDITVDYTAELSSNEFASPTVGQELAVSGTQPLIKGVILAEVMGSSAVTKASVRAIGRASKGIEGSGAQKQGIEGSGVVRFGIEGSGLTSLGIEGSGIKSQGIEGSGVASLGIEGSGLASLGIEGSGIKSQGIEGSGLVSLGIEGSGLASLGIEGSGIKSLGIEGSGLKSQGIEGSGIRGQ